MNYMLLPTSPVLVLADRKGTRRHFKLSYAGVDNDAMLPHNVAFHTTFFFILMFLWQPFRVLDPGQIIAMCECLVCFKRNHGCDFCLYAPLLRAHLLFSRLCFPKRFSACIGGVFGA